MHGKLKLHATHSEELIVHFAEAYEYDIYFLVMFQSAIIVEKMTGNIFSYGILAYELPCDNFMPAETVDICRYLLVRLGNEFFLDYFDFVQLRLHIQSDFATAFFDGYELVCHVRIGYLAVAEKYEIVRYVLQKSVQ